MATRSFRPFKLGDPAHARYRLVNTLKDALKLARKGKLDSIALVVILRDNTFCTAVASSEPESLDRMRLLGALRVFEHDLINDMDHPEDVPIQRGGA